MKKMLGTQVGASTRRSGVASLIKSNKLAPASIPAMGIGSNESMTLIRNEQNGTPCVITDIPRSIRKSLRMANAGNPAFMTTAFIEQNKDLFGIQNPSAELQSMGMEVDQQGNNHVAFHQTFEGIPVWGADLVAHFDNTGELYYLNCHIVPTPKTVAKSSISVSDQSAIDIAASHNQAHATQSTLGEQTARLLNYTGPSAKSYIWIDGKTGVPYRVWFVELRPNLRDHWYYFVDATTGEIRDQYNASEVDGPVSTTATDLNGVNQTIHAYQVGSNYYLIDATKPTWNAAQSTLPDNPVGGLLTLDAQNKDLGPNTQIFHIVSNNNSWTDPTSVSAHSNVGKVFDYYYSVFGRKGIDGAGSTALSVIHATENGASWANAVWNGSMMIYGDGGSLFKPLAGALDVAAHEMTHGVIQATVNLEYKNQSGALNESIADIFGAMVDNANWTMGESVVKTNMFPSGALRNLADPHNGGSGPQDNGWQPATMSEFQNLTEDQDHGGVHTNSGITNHACYLIANAIGREKTAQIYYQVLANKYLNQQATFVDMRLAALRAATDLYGANSAEQTAVTNAFDAVGITTGAGSLPPADTTAVSGEQWVAVINGGVSDRSLYKARPNIAADGDIVLLTSTQVYTGSSNPISVSDDGSVVFFVDDASDIRGIKSDGTNETVLSSAGVWSSIAVSPGAKYLAATTVFSDSVIYIFDLVNSTVNAYRLYSPTTQDGVRSYITQFADALDWNLDGTVLIYDAYNSISLAGGNTIDYWDINVLDPSNGQIYRVLPKLPEGVSVGDPAFAHNNDRYFAFDMFHNGADTVLAVDLYLGQGGYIQANGASPAHPRYSPSDDTIITQQVVSDVPAIRKTPLNANHIVASGNPLPYLVRASHPVWYGMGSRPTGPQLETVSISLAKAWNMVSLPVTVEDGTASALFPNAASNFYSYNPVGGYIHQDVLENKIGYWIKYDVPQSQNIRGVKRGADTVSLKPGWNMIGSITHPVAVTAIQQLPGGIVQSPYYNFKSGYASTDSVKPGSAYWVKSSQNGSIILKSTGNSTPLTGIAPAYAEPQTMNRKQ